MLISSILLSSLVSSTSLPESQCTNVPIEVTGSALITLKANMEDKNLIHFDKGRYRTTVTKDDLYKVLRERAKENEIIEKPTAILISTLDKEWEKNNTLKYIEIQNSLLSVNDESIKGSAIAVVGLMSSYFVLLLEGKATVTLDNEGVSEISVKRYKAYDESLKNKYVSGHMFLHQNNKFYDFCMNDFTEK